MTHQKLFCGEAEILEQIQSFKLNVHFKIFGVTGKELVEENLKILIFALIDYVETMWKLNRALCTQAQLQSLAKQSMNLK